MNKDELVEVLGQRLGSKEAAADAIDAILEVIVREVAYGRKVGLAGFGTFERATRPDRLGRNPRTGATVLVHSSGVPKFKAGDTFRAAVAEPGQGTGSRKSQRRKEEALAAEANRRKGIPRSEGGPRITVVSGGLPGLGKRR